MATDAFLSSLAELRSMPHTHVSEKPVGRAEKPNDFGVLVTLNIPEKNASKSGSPSLGRRAIGRTSSAGWYWNDDRSKKACHLRDCMREVGALPPLANARAGGSTDAALLEIEEVLGMRYCDPSQMTAVALRNPVDEDDERLEYLVSGRFGSGPDDRGFHSVAWVFDGDLLDHVDAEEVKSAMHANKNRMDKEFAALADACNAEM